MRIGQVKEYLRFKAQQPRPDSVIMIGPGGIGKTQIVYQIGKELNLKVHVINLQHIYPEQLMGVPKSEGTWVRWLRPRDLPEEKCILFLDEITNASALKQNAAMQLLMEKRVGDHRLHSDTLIVAAGNRPEDNILAKVLPSLVVNRCTFIQVEPPTADEWLTDFAIPNEIHPLIRAFIKSRPQFLFEEANATSEQQFARPRCWERLSKVLDHLLQMPPEVRDELIIADVGPGAGSAFARFINAKLDVPTIDEFIDGKLPETPDGLCILVEDIITELKTLGRKAGKKAQERFEKLMWATWKAFKEKLEIFRYITLALNDNNTLQKLIKMQDFLQEVRQYKDLMEILLAGN